MLVNLASNAAMPMGREDGRKTDKIPLDERFEWALGNEEVLINYANNPKLSRGWMFAEKPWQFLAGCIEFRNLRNWQKLFPDDPYGYESHGEAYLDG